MKMILSCFVIFLSGFGFAQETRSTFPLEGSAAKANGSRESDFRAEVNCGITMKPDVVRSEFAPNQVAPLGATSSRPIIAFATRRPGSTHTHGVYFVESNGATYFEFNYNGPVAPTLDPNNHEYPRISYRPEGDFMPILVETKLNIGDPSLGLVSPPSPPFVTNPREDIEGRPVNDHHTQNDIVVYLTRAIRSIPGARDNRKVDSERDDRYLERVRALICECREVDRLRSEVDELIQNAIFDDVREQL